MIVAMIKTALRILLFVHLLNQIRVLLRCHASLQLHRRGELSSLLCEVRGQQGPLLNDLSVWSSFLVGCFHAIVQVFDPQRVLLCCGQCLCSGADLWCVVEGGKRVNVGGRSSKKCVNEWWREEVKSERMVWGKKRWLVVRERKYQLVCVGGWAQHSTAQHSTAQHSKHYMIAKSYLQ